MCLTLSLLFLDESTVPSVYAHSFQSGTFLTKFGLDCEGKVILD